MKSNGCNDFQLSVQESQRLHRALWRWQIYSRVFGGHFTSAAPSEAIVAVSESMYDEDEILEIFLSLFPMHEVEELGCLRSYAQHKLKEYDPSTTPPLVEQIVTSGPEFLYHMLQASFGTKLNDLPASRNVCYEITIKEAIDAYERVVDRGSWPWKKMKEPLSSEREPNDGWIWASSRGVENTDFKLRRWGYVFWDRKRLDAWGVTKEHMLKWPVPRTWRHDMWM